MANDGIDITNKGAGATPKRGREVKTKDLQDNQIDDMKSPKEKKAKEENEEERRKKEERKKREKEKKKRKEEERKEKEEKKKREEDDRKEKEQEGRKINEADSIEKINYKICHMALATTLNNLENNTKNPQIRKIIDCYNPYSRQEPDLMKAQILSCCDEWENKENILKETIKYIWPEVDMN